MRFLVMSRWSKGVEKDAGGGGVWGIKRGKFEFETAYRRMIDEQIGMHSAYNNEVWEYQEDERERESTIQI